MSQFGARTGYPLNTQRMSFLTERFKAEKNSALRAYFDSPEVERAFESTLEPLPPPVLPPLRKRGFGEAHLLPAEKLQQPLQQPQLPAGEAAQAQPAPLRLPSIAQSALRLQTTSQWSWRPPAYGKEAQCLFGAPRKFGKPINKNVLYREEIFRMKNIGILKA